MRYLRENFTIYHHNDPDGYFGAAMCRELIDQLFLVQNSGMVHGEVIENPIRVNYQELNYPKVFPIDTMSKGDIVFIVDVSFGENTFNQLKQVCEKAEKVYWIDHHATSFNDVVPLLEKEPIENLQYFVDTRYCGAMNTYICIGTHYFNRFDDNFNEPPYNKYLKTLCKTPKFKYCGDDKDKQDTTFEDLDKKTEIYKLKGYFYVDFHDDNDNVYNLCIPTYLILLDDYDCFKQKFAESDYFTYAIRNRELSYYLAFVRRYKRLHKQAKEEKGANLYSVQKEFNETTLAGMIRDGSLIVGFLKSDYDKNIVHAFVCDFSKYGGPEKTICLNQRGNSWVFSNLYDEYDMCCMFHHDKDHWTYSLYANNEAQAKGIDCSKIAARIDPNGGGHPGASGFSTDELIFDKNNILK